MRGRQVSARAEGRGYAPAQRPADYNGVAVLTRAPGAEVCRGIPRFTDDQSRVLAADYDGVRLVSVYVPNGQSVGSDKYAYKLRWLEALADWLAGELATQPRLAVMGDFNVAPEDRDVHDPKAWEGQVLFSLPERAALKRIVDLGLADAFRSSAARALLHVGGLPHAGVPPEDGAANRHVMPRPRSPPRGRACTIDLAPRRLELPFRTTRRWSARSPALVTCWSATIALSAPITPPGSHTASGAPAPPLELSIPMQATLALVPQAALDELVRAPPTFGLSIAWLSFIEGDLERFACARGLWVFSALGHDRSSALQQRRGKALFIEDAAATRWRAIRWWRSTHTRASSG